MALGLEDDVEEEVAITNPDVEGVSTKATGLSLLTELVRAEALLLLLLFLGFKYALLEPPFPLLLFAEARNPKRLV